MSVLEELSEKHPLPTWRPLAYFVMLMLSSFAAWGYWTNLDEVAVAMGEVVPLGKVKTIQHLEGGIIEDIFVAEGDHVKPGDDLVQLDLGATGANREELLAKLDGYRIHKARLQAEVKGVEPVFPEDLIERRPNLVETAMHTYNGKKRDLEGKKAVIFDKIRQRELAVDELNAKMDAVTRNLSITRKRFAMSTDLLKDGLTAKMDHLSLQAELEKLEGELLTLKPAIPKAKSSIQEAKNQIIEEENAFRLDSLEELESVEQAMTQTEEVLAKATDQGLRALIKSPIEGVVKNMPFTTIGGVVRPGEPIMEIVPTGANLVIEAKLQPTDRGYVHQGQRAVVKISTFDFVRYGSLEGVVSLVAPDTTTDQDGTTYFRVVVEVEKDYLGDIPGLFEISPGMEATVDIHTGRKTVFDYLVMPVLKMKHQAFRER